MHKILVTGSAGFFGSLLLPALRAARYDVTGIDRREQVELRGDVNDLSINDLAPYQTVIHLANTARIEPSWHDIQGYVYNNVTVTAELFRRCQFAGVKHFFYFSSSSVYGNNNISLQSEDSPLAPTSPYAVSKVAAEQMLTALAATHKTKLTIVRPFTMYGTTMDMGPNALAVGKFVNAYVNNQPLTIHGDGCQRRDFLLVDEAIEMMLLLLNHAKGNDTYNLGSGENVSVKEIANAVSQNQTMMPNRLGPEYNTCADMSKIKALGYEPKTKILQWLNQQKQNNFKEFT